MAQLLPDPQFNEDSFIKLLVELACNLNAQCGDRTKPNGKKHEYSGFSVSTEGLESAIAAPFQSFGGHPRFASVNDVASALLINIATGHHFQDGNKRTALLISLVYLRFFSINVRPPSPEAGSRLVEDLVTRTDLSYEERRQYASQKLINWTDLR